VFLTTVRTHPNYGHHGYGSTISKYALKTVLDATGCDISLVHSSCMAESVYEKIGFKEIGTAAFTVYKPT
jgi:predicted GNAT family acetyltransferase